MKSYFFAYSEIGKIVQLSFPVSKVFRKKEYCFAANLDKHFGSSETLETNQSSVLFSLECLKMLMDIDLASSGYSDFDSVAQNIRKRNDFHYDVYFMTDRSCELYKKRLTEIIAFFEDRNFTWFNPTSDFMDFCSFIFKKMEKIDSKTACILILPT